MDIDRIVLVRHGEAYMHLVGNGVDEGLLESGKLQIKRLTDKFIKPIVDDDYYYIMTGPSNRTTISGLEIQNILYPRVYGWCMQTDTLEQRIALSLADLELIANLLINHPHKDYDFPKGIYPRGMMMVSHHTILPTIMNYLAEQNGIDMPRIEFGEGDAVYLDLDEKSHKIYRQD